MASGHHLQRPDSGSNEEMENGVQGGAPAPAHPQQRQQSAHTAPPRVGDNGAGPSRVVTTAGGPPNPQQAAIVPAARSASGQRRAPIRRKLNFGDADLESALLAAQALLRHPPVQAAEETPKGRWLIPTL